MGSSNKRMEKEQKKRDSSPHRGREAQDGESDGRKFARERRSPSKGRGDRFTRDNRRAPQGRDSGEGHHEPPRHRKQQLIKIEEVDEDEGRNFHGGRGGDRRHDKFGDNERAA
mmetsp:Transcript_41511/g.63367  ORF Transcript_41511/g.63367 Transcript_41511/m.63367 type:complete len:113 (-) Transcript_41511:3-341(-)